MKTVLFANQKGGVGKTTLSVELYRNLLADGHNVSFYNLDNQGGGIPTTEVENPDFVVVDTPGSIENNFRERCEHADIVIIPCRPSTNDLEPTKTSWDIATIGCKKVYLIVNEYDSRNSIDQEFLEYIAGTDMKLLCKIPRSTKFAQAAAKETSVTMMKNTSEPAVAAVRKMVNKIEEEL